MATERLFYALDLADEVVDRLQSLQEAFAAEVPDPVNIRWTPPENMHLTLKFLGSQEAELAEEFGVVMDELAGGLAPFEMTLQNVGAFPHPRHPRILWVGVDLESAERLAELHRRLEERLEAYDVDRDEHAFKAHVTFGRIKSSNAPKLSSVESALPSGPFGTTAVDEILLYESELSPDGSTYTLRHRSPLGG